MAPPDLSVVVPMLNEAETVRLLVERTSRVLDELDLTYELILVDDGSTDGTFDVIRQLAETCQAVRGIELSRNFGHQNALLAGLSQAKGDYVLTMDGDLQHPPELIPELWLQARTGAYDVVYTVRRDSRDVNWFKRSTAGLFYRLFSYLCNVNLSPNAADFRLFSRQVCQEILRIEERDLFLRGLFSWVGFRQKAVEFRAQPRAAGETKYPLLKMLAFSLSGLTSFTVVPIRASLLLCGFSLLIAAAYSLYALYLKLVLKVAVQGWTSLLILMSFYFAGVFIMLGIIGEYVAKIHMETKKRPQFIIRSLVPGSMDQ